MLLTTEKSTEKSWKWAITFLIINWSCKWNKKHILFNKTWVCLKGHPWTICSPNSKKGSLDCPRTGKDWTLGNSVLVWNKQSKVAVCSLWGLKGRVPALQSSESQLWLSRRSRSFCSYPDIARHSLTTVARRQPGTAGKPCMWLGPIELHSQNSPTWLFPDFVRSQRSHSPEGWGVGLRPWDWVHHRHLSAHRAADQPRQEGEAQGATSKLNTTLPAPLLLREIHWQILCFY